MYSYTVVILGVLIFGSCNSQRFQPNIWTVDTDPTDSVNVSGMTFFHTKTGEDAASMWRTEPSDNTNTYTNFLSSQSESRDVDAIQDSSTPGDTTRLQLPFPTFGPPTMPGDTPFGTLPEPVVPSQPIKPFLSNVGNNVIGGGSNVLDLRRTNDKPAFDLSKFGILENNVPDDDTNGLNSYNTFSSSMTASDSSSGKDQPRKPFPFSQIDGNPPSKRKGPSMIASGSFKDHSRLPMFRVKTAFVDHSMLKMPDDKLKKKPAPSIETTTVSTTPPTTPPPSKSRGLALPGVMENAVFKSNENKVTLDKPMKKMNGEVHNKARVSNPVVPTTLPKPVTPSDRLIVDDLYPDVSFPDNSMKTGEKMTDDQRLSLNSKDAPTTNSIGKISGTGKGLSQSSGRSRGDLADTADTNIPERASEFYPQTPWGDTIILPTPGTKISNDISDPKLSVTNDKNINNTPARGQDIMSVFSGLDSNVNSVQNPFGQNSVTTNNMLPTSNDITSNRGTVPANTGFDLTQPLAAQNGATNGFNRQNVGTVSSGQMATLPGGQNVFNSGQMSGNNNQGFISSSLSNQNVVSPGGMGLASSTGPVSSNVGATSTTFQQSTINGFQNVPQTVFNGNQLSSNNQMRTNGQTNVVNGNIVGGNTPQTGQSPNNINSAQTTFTRGNINNQQFSGQFNNANVPQTMFNGELNGGSSIMSIGQQIVPRTINGQQGTAIVQQTSFNRQQTVQNGSPPININGQPSSTINGQQTGFIGQGRGAINTLTSGQQINANIQTSQNNGQVLNTVPLSPSGQNVLTNGFQRVPGQQQIGGNVPVLNGQVVNGQVNTMNRVSTTFPQQGNGLPAIPQSNAGTSVQQINSMGRPVNTNIPQPGIVNQQNIAQNQGINNNNQPQIINGFQSVNGQQGSQNSQQTGTSDRRFNSFNQQSLNNGPNGQQQFTNGQQGNVVSQQSLNNGQQLNTNGQQSFTNGQQQITNGQQTFTNGQLQNTNGQNQIMNGPFNTNGQQMNRINQQLTDTNGRPITANNMLINTNQLPTNNGQQVSLNNSPVNTNNMIPATNGQQIPTNRIQANINNQIPTNTGQQRPINSFPVNTNNQLQPNNGQQIPINSIPLNTNNRLPINNGQQIPINSIPVNSNNRLPTNNGQQIPRNNLPVNTNNRLPTNNGQQIPINNFPVNSNNRLPLNNGQQIPINNLPVNTNNRLPLNNGQQIPINNLPVNTNNRLPPNNGQQIPINSLQANTNNPSQQGNSQQNGRGMLLGTNSGVRTTQVQNRLNTNNGPSMINVPQGGNNNQRFGNGPIPITGQRNVPGSALNTRTGMPINGGNAANIPANTFNQQPARGGPAFPTVNNGQFQPNLPQGNGMNGINNNIQGNPRTFQQMGNVRNTQMNPNGMRPPQVSPMNSQNALQNRFINGNMRGIPTNMQNLVRNRNMQMNRGPGPFTGNGRQNPGFPFNGMDFFPGGPMMPFK